MLTHLSLFSGIGGLDVAAEAAGFVTVGQCEWADYPTKVLEKHWPNVPRWRDIRTLTGESFYERTGLRTVDVISGGFPCQPFSVAGQRKGKEDDRYLWPEMLRVIREIRPLYVVGENVANIVNMALDTVLSDLENIGYEGQAFVIPACGVDAPHKRERVAIVAHAIDRGGFVRWDGKLQDVAKDGRNRTDNGRRTTASIAGQRRQDEPWASGMADGVRTAIHGANANTNSAGLEGRTEKPILDALFTNCSSRERERERERETEVPGQPNRTCGSHSAWENWPDEPGICRVVDGLPYRLERIRCLGNAVVPQQFYPFFKAIYDIETKGCITK